MRNRVVLAPAGGLCLAAPARNSRRPKKRRLQLAGNTGPGVTVDSNKAAAPEALIAGIALGSPDFQKR